MTIDDLLLDTGTNIELRTSLAQRGWVSIQEFTDEDTFGDRLSPPPPARPDRIQEVNLLFAVEWHRTSRVIERVLGSISAAWVGETFGFRSRAPTPVSDRQWRIKNRRRQILLRRQLDDRLSDEELRELEQLDEGVAAYVNMKFPLPFAELAELEAEIDALKGE